MNGQGQKFPVFVGHVFKQEQFDDLRDALEEAFSKFKFINLVYADTERFHGALFPKIQRLIDSALFCIFDISEQNVNVSLELGFALGRKKLCIPIIREGATVPSDIAGSERITFSSYKELTKRISDKAQGIINAAFGIPGRIKDAIPLKFLQYLNKHSIGEPIDVDGMKKALKTKNISSLDIDKSIKLCVRDGFITEQNGKIFLTPKGEDFILKMIMHIKKFQKESKTKPPAKSRRKTRE